MNSQVSFHYYSFQLINYICVSLYKKHTYMHVCVDTSWTTLVWTAVYTWLLIKQILQQRCTTLSLAESMDLKPQVWRDGHKATRRFRWAAGPYTVLLGGPLYVCTYIHIYMGLPESRYVLLVRGQPSPPAPSEVGGPHGCGPAACGGRVSPRPGAQRGGRVTADRPGRLGASPEQPWL